MAFSSATLELNQILDQIAAYGFSHAAKDKITETNPSSDFSLVLEMLGQTDEITRLVNRFGKLPFIEDYDALKLAKSLSISTALTISDFVKLRRIVQMELAFERYHQQMNSTYQHIYPYLNALKHHQVIINEINQIISDDQEIYDYASTQLHEIRRSIKTKSSLLEKLLATVLIKYASYLNESLVVMRNGRYAIPVKESFKHKVKGVVHDVSASKQTVYIEPDDIRQVTQDLEHLGQLESDEILKILTKLTAILSPFSASLMSHIEKFIDLDVMHAKSLYSIKIKGILPTINQNGKIDMKQARHPLIDEKVVVPIDVKLNETTKVLMITGPNTGGKTVALKTVGLLTLMLQSGILVPVNPGSEMALFHHVFADIGDEQSIAQSLSTFSSHLTKIKTMFDVLKGSAIVLLDELGSGTDPIEGVSLAIAIIDKLRSKNNVRLILTTHYSELKLYAYEHEDILTASVAFDKETLRPLYKLQLGISGSSHAISIAKRLGLSQDIINQASTLLAGRQTNLAKSLEKLSDEQNELERLKDELLAKEQELNRQIQSYKDKNRYFEKEKDNLLEKVQQKEIKKYEKLKTELLELIEELSKKETLTKPEAASIKGKLNQSTAEKTEKRHETLKVDDHVFITTYQQTGVVTAIKQNKYTVSLGQFELTFDRNELEKSEHQPKPDKKIKPQPAGTTPKKDGSIELDLRGVRYEDVGNLLDKAIDNAMLANLPFIRIIHGFGTGAVRKAVYAYIKTSPYIKSHRYGGAGEGLNGVTIITL